MSSYLWHYEGTVDATGRILTLETEGPQPDAPGKNVAFREVTEFKSNDYRVFTSSRQTADGQWTTMLTIHYRRRKCSFDASRWRGLTPTRCFGNARPPASYPGPHQRKRLAFDRRSLRSEAVVGISPMAKHRIFTTSVARVYPLYVTKAERKGRTKAEVDEIIRWLTGYTQKALDAHLAKETTFEDFFARAPRPNPARASIKGLICGVRIEDIKETTMREIRYLDKLIDELAKGRPMEKILRTA